MVRVKTVLVCGSAGSGKTALIRRFAGGEWTGSPRRTVGLDESAGSVIINPSDESLLDELRVLLPPEGLELQIMEIGGKDGHLRGAPRGRPIDGLLLCYDLGDRASFQKAAHLLLQHRSDRHQRHDSAAVVACTEAPAHLAVVLCGTKLDAEGAGRPRGVSGNEALAFAQTNSIRHVVTASSRTGEGVSKVFGCLAAAMLEAEEEAEAERYVAAGAPPSLQHFGLRSKHADMTSPQGQRPHEPPAHSPAPLLVEVIDAEGVASVARPLSICLERGLLHRAVHVWICDPKSGGLLLRRYAGHAPKFPQRWGPSCHGEILCYGSTGNASAGPHTSEVSVKAAMRVMGEQLGARLAPEGLEHWFSCTSNDGLCRELLDVYVAILASHGGLRTQYGEEVE